MGNLFHGPTPFIILFVVLLLFGAPKLPALAKSLGQSMKILKKEVTTNDDDKLAADAAPAEATANQASVAAPAAESVEDELVKARAEAAAAKAEADALRAAAELRAEGKSEV